MNKHLFNVACGCIAVIAALSLPGCGVSAEAWGHAELLCKEHGGVKYMRATAKTTSVDAVCNDGYEIEASK